MYPLWTSTMTCDIMKENKRRLSESVAYMEFHEKLQRLRKQRGITQEELAQALFVSRTAVSKWESGRGYPNLDSLKAIAKFYAVTVDELLSGGEILTIAEEDTRAQRQHICDMVFGSLDLSTAVFFFLPIFGQRVGGVLYEVSLLSLTEIAAYMRVLYFAIVIAISIFGLLTLVLRSCRLIVWMRCKRAVSLLLNAAGALLFILSPQPYAAALLFIFLAIKVLLLSKKC